MKLRTQLALLVLVALLPVALLAAMLGGSLIRQERETFRRGAEDRVRALITAVDSELRGSINVLQALANVRSLDAADLGYFRGMAEEILAAQPNWLTIGLARPDGQQIVNLRAAAGTALPRLAQNEQAYLHLVEARTPAVGELSVDPVTRHWDFAVHVPVIRNGRLAYILSAEVDPESIRALLPSQDLPARWEGRVVDRSGRVVASTLPSRRSLGELVTQDLRQALAAAPVGWYRDSDGAGQARYRAYRRSDSSGWTFVLSIPASEVDGTALHAAGMFVFTLAAAILLAFGLERLVGRRISGPIAALAAKTDRLAAGERVEMASTAPLAELRSLETALRHAAGAQLALRRAEEQTRSIVDHVLDGIITIDAQGAIESFNPAAERLFGYEAAEVLGRNVKLLMPEPYQAGHDGSSPRSHS